MAGIGLQSATGVDIDNDQCAERSDNDLADFLQSFRAKWQSSSCYTSPEALLRYNCHGLTFASRRTWIDDARLIQRILTEDGYSEVSLKNVLPGDVIVYFGLNDIAIHSGLVIEPPSNERFSVPKILSKWAKAFEVVHWANSCPYDLTNVKYFRLTRDIKKS